MLHTWSRKPLGGGGLSSEKVLQDETLFFSIIFFPLQLRSSYFSPVLRIWCFFPSHRKNLPLSNFWWNSSKLSETKPCQRFFFFSLSPFLCRYYHHWSSIPLNNTSNDERLGNVNTSHKIKRHGVNKGILTWLARLPLLFNPKFSQLRPRKIFTFSEHRLPMLG